MGLRIRLAQSGHDADRGRHFGVIGAPLTMNPHDRWGVSSTIRYQNWLKGWQSGRSERLQARKKGEDHGSTV